MIAVAATADQDLYAAARADMETSGYDLVCDEGIWIVEGRFSNPVGAAITLGSANQSKAAVLASNGNRSTPLLWAWPCMAIADSRTDLAHVHPVGRGIAAVANCGRARTASRSKHQQMAAHT